MAAELTADDIGYEEGPIPGVEPEVMECIPPNGLVHEYVWWAAQVMYSPPVYHVGAILPALAYDLAVGGWNIEPRGRQIALQTFLVGDPSAGKSYALRRLKESHYAMLAKTVPGWHVGLSPWIQAEGTIPGIVENIHDQERTIGGHGLTPAILFHEEVSSLLDKGGAIIDVLMQLFDGVSDYKRNLQKYRTARRKGEEVPDTIIAPAISAVFCGTPSSFERVLDSGHFEGGLVSRALWFGGKLDPIRWEQNRFEEPWEHAEAAWRWFIERWTHHGQCLAGHLALGRASLAPLDSEIRSLLKVHLGSSFLKAEKQGNAYMAASYNRGIDLAKLIASLYALSRGTPIVGPDDMLAAISLVKWSMRTAQSLGDLSADSEGFRTSIRAQKLIMRAGTAGVTRTELQLTLRISANELDTALVDLELREAITTRKIRTGKPGRPATRIFIVELAPKQVIDLQESVKAE